MKGHEFSLAPSCSVSCPLYLFLNKKETKRVKLNSSLFHWLWSLGDIHSSGFIRTNAETIPSTARTATIRKNGLISSQGDLWPVLKLYHLSLPLYHKPYR